MIERDDDVPRLPIHEADYAIAAVCRETGHAFEGQKVGQRCVGRCARCGVGVMTDGS